jgi:hypothetical protein
VSISVYLAKAALTVVSVRIAVLLFFHVAFAVPFLSAALEKG